jgi:hypothetical protein
MLIQTLEAKLKASQTEYEKLMKTKWYQELETLRYGIAKANYESKAALKCNIVNPTIAFEDKQNEKPIVLPRRMRIIVFQNLLLL